MKKRIKLAVKSDIRRDDGVECHRFFFTKKYMVSYYREGVYTKSKDIDFQKVLILASHWDESVKYKEKEMIWWLPESTRIYGIDLDKIGEWL